MTSSADTFRAELRRLGDYPGVLTSATLREVTSGVVIWAIEGSPTVQLRAIVLRTGDNPAVPDGSQGARVLKPDSAGSVRLRSEVEYSIEVCLRDERRDCTSQSFRLQSRGAERPDGKSV